MLSGNEIMNRTKTGEILILPFDKSKVNPNSYNITLNKKLKVYTEEVLDSRRDNPYKEIIIPEEGMILYPGELYIGSTNEYTETRGLVPCIDGRSSSGRLGISVHITAGFGDNGFDGNWTLEITVVKPVKVYPNMEIGQVYYQTIDGEPGPFYNGRYQGQREAETSRMFKG